MTHRLSMEPGQPLLAGVYRLTEGVHYNYSTYGHTLVISMARPAGDDVRAINRNDAAFALVVRESIVFFLAKIGRRTWTASHYNWWINPPNLRPDPLVALRADNTTFDLQTCLADARTGMVAAVRTFRLSADFGRVLLETVANQIRDGLDPWHQLGMAREFLDRSPDQNWLLEDAVCAQFFQADEGKAGQAVGEAELGQAPKRRCASVH